MIHIDEDAVRRACETSDAALRSLAEQGGPQSLQARANLALMTPFGMWLASEINRGTPVGALLDGVAAAVSNMLISTADSAGQPRAQIYNSFAYTLAQNVAHAVQGKLHCVSSSEVKPTPAGRA